MPLPAANRILIALPALSVTHRPTTGHPFSAATARTLPAEGAARVEQEHSP
ncbi:hypothetical protein [Streptomyces sp. NPDC001568]|uniref:hypothetical protein n=1 Tax=Streptomyces sp. NPDC001568 TaxID=3364588 RepID=UPI0036A5EBF9